MSLLLIGLLVLGLVGNLIGYWHKAKLHYHFMTISRGKVYQSAAMPADVLKEKVRRYGIKAVIDLRRPENGLEEERAVLADLGIAYYNLPSNQIPRDEVVEEFLKIMDNHTHRPVLIHCKNGIGRSIILAAIYRMEYEGWSNDRARRVAYWQSTFGSFSSGGRKGQFLMRYVPRWRRSEASVSCASTMRNGIITGERHSCGYR